MIENLVNEFLEDKQDLDYIVCSYAELRLNKNLSDGEIFEFKNIIKNKLEGNGYRVYFRGMKFIYKNNLNVVKDNMVLVAIKVGKGSIFNVK